MLRIETAERDGILLITLTGEFTPEQISDFMAHIEEAISEERTKVLVDTQNVPFINSTAFGTLIKARGAIRAEGGELALAGLSGMPKETFEVLQLGAMIQSFATIEDGLEGLRWVDAAPAAVPDGTSVEVEFRFKGHHEILLAGAGWQAASLESASERELQFLWSGQEGLDVFRVFTPETTLEVRSTALCNSSSAPHAARGTVLNVIPAPEGAALVQVELVDIDDEFRAGIREFVRTHTS